MAALAARAEVVVARAEMPAMMRAAMAVTGADPCAAAPVMLAVMPIVVTSVIHAVPVAGGGRRGDQK